MAVHKNHNLLGRTKGDSVTAVTVGTPGSSYETAPDVAFSAAPAGGRTATGYAVLTADAVTDIVVTDGGKGYTVAPTISFSGGGGSLAAATCVITQANGASVNIVQHTDGSWSWVVQINGVNRTYKYRGTNAAVNILLKKLLTRTGGLVATEHMFGTNPL